MNLFVALEAKIKAIDEIASRSSLMTGVAADLDLLKVVIKDGGHGGSQQDVKDLATSIAHWFDKHAVMRIGAFIVQEAIGLRPSAIQLLEIAERIFSLSPTDFAQQKAQYAETVVSRKQDKRQNATGIFVGHGHSSCWKDLRDFISNRLGMQVQEFNSVPIAGYSTRDRLQQMLDECDIAFLVLTAEDVLANGEEQARMNVAHELGLWQGRHGFERAVILLEDGCREFSNIVGLGQVRFPKGNIMSCSEEIRRILEREGFL